MKKKILIISLIVVLISALIATPFIVKAIKDKKNNPVKEYRAQKMKTYEEENNSMNGCDVVFVGDSLTDGYPIYKFYSDIKAYNRGIGGDRTQDVLDRIEVSVYNAKPKVIVILIGGNDVLAGKSEDYIIGNYRKILNLFKENLPNTKVIIQSNYPLATDYAKFNTTMLSLNGKLSNLASEFNYTFVDLYPYLLDTQTNELTLNLTPDSVHLNESGYEIVTSVLKPIILSKLV